MNKYNLEDFKKIWKETSKEGILNQFYYEHIELEQLQSNWNSLREWLEEQQKEPNSTISITFTRALVKMNELEGVDNENN